MDTLRDLSEGAVGIFFKVEDNVVESAAVRCGRFAVPFDSRCGHLVEKPDDQTTGYGKEPHIKSCEGDTKGIHWKSLMFDLGRRPVSSCRLG